MFTTKDPSSQLSLLNTFLWVIHISGMLIAATSPAWILGLVALTWKIVFKKEFNDIKDGATKL